ncbi:ATP-binding cassette domain-containing protein [Facklamia sp. 253]|nr:MULTISPECIES: ATP-binding cassette domain-containing protein [unclassified Facklamia]NEW65181.1 ATP-binding cassette domain-containing protein [Facklamia sp. 252]NEW68572.1 ATP-binding cassette domain-containing protein [Facklamia sp. 253]
MLITNLSKKFFHGKKTQTVLDDIELEIPKGQLTAIIGPNGAGKSTLLNIMSRLESADAGTITLDQRALTDWTRDSFAKRVTILRQSQHFDVKLTVREFVEFGRYPYSKGRLTEQDHQKVAECLAYLNLEQMSHRFIDELSGGQRQRVLLAMIMAQDTEFILLDEPLNNLDISQTIHLMNLLKKLVAQYDKRIVMIVHDINIAAQFADYVVAMKEGKICAQGGVSQMMTPEILEPLYNIKVERIEHNGFPIINFYEE